ncbi:hypothetical protein GOBAR_AA35042 [Gossypium barbadense]|uniref:Uncharacterized protein n=1 Tax=Gossypium barbadense TaxID=3634 RepID=A0A2P5W3I0_GOSBA|nr:hypothetical protein GOBAR_AA35042 [Gossypium barbadense]
MDKGLIWKLPQLKLKEVGKDEISGLIDELVINTKKVAVAASREIEKWRR